MKTRIKIYLTTTILLNLMVHPVLGQKTITQKPIRDLFPDKQVIAEVEISNMRFIRQSINSTKRYVSVFGYPDPGSSMANVYLYDTDGKLVWEKKINRVKNIVMADESDKVIVFYDIDQYGAKGWNACFDRLGNKLWELRVPVPGITSMSPNGKYGIISVAGEENGDVKVYDLESGMELEAPIPQGSHGFRAQFIDSERIVVVIQNIDVSRDQEALKRAMQMKREGKLKLRVKKGESTTGRGVPNTWIKTYHPGLFIIYDIPSQTILTQRELFSPDGHPLYIPWEGGKYISVSPDKKHIALALIKFLDDPSHNKRNLTLIQVDLKGNVEWENDNLPRTQISGLFDLNNGMILVSEPPHMNDLVRRFHLVNRIDGKTIWRYIVNKQGKDRRGVGIIKNLFIQDNRLVIQTNDKVFNSRIHIIDIATGEVLQDGEYSNEEILLVTSPYSTIVYNKAKNQLQVLK